MPKSAKQALWMAGLSEWATGSATTPKSSVSASMVS